MADPHDRSPVARGGSVGPTSPSLRPLLVAVVVLSSLPSAGLTQDLEPRTYVNAPVGLNFLLLGYGYSSFGGATLEQRTIYALQGHFSYTFRPGLWLALAGG